MSTQEPTGPTINDTLNAINRLWDKAQRHSDQADLLENEAGNERNLAGEANDDAETLWRPLVETFPEWEDAFRSAIDPRTIEVDVDVTVNDQNLVLIQPDQEG